MPHFSAPEIEQFVKDSINQAATPVGSQGWQRTPEILDPLFDRGDLGDAWVFTCGVVQYIVNTLGLRNVNCPCGDPEPHQQRVAFGFVPINRDGSLDTGQAILPEDVPPDDVPPEIRDQVPAANLLARMINAEMNDSPEQSLEVWSDAHELTLCGYVMSLAIRQAGELRRSQVAARGGN